MNYENICSCNYQAYPYEGQVNQYRRQTNNNGLLLIAAAFLLIPLIRQWGSGRSFFY